MFGFLKDISFQKLFLKKKRNSRKKKRKRKNVLPNVGPWPS
jgi:hypothetical protein